MTDEFLSPPYDNYTTLLELLKTWGLTCSYNYQETGLHVERLYTIKDKNLTDGVDFYHFYQLPVYVPAIVKTEKGKINIWKLNFEEKYLCHNDYVPLIREHLAHEILRTGKFEQVLFVDLSQKFKICFNYSDLPFPDEELFTSFPPSGIINGSSAIILAYKFSQNVTETVVSVAKEDHLAVASLLSAKEISKEFRQPNKVSFEGLNFTYSYINCFLQSTPRDDLSYNDLVSAFDPQNQSPTLYHFIRKTPLTKEKDTKAWSLTQVINGEFDGEVTRYVLFDVALDCLAKRKIKYASFNPLKKVFYVSIQEVMTDFEKEYLESEIQEATGLSTKVLSPNLEGD